MEIQALPESDMEHLVTPFFRHQSIENVPQSEIKRSAVMEVREVVELRFAGDKNYAPVLPVESMYRRDGHNIITYAERFADQYRAFLQGSAQEAEGTPLELLVPFGISENQISLCRVLKIYSIEALYHLEGQNLRNLGMNANTLKDMASNYMAQRSSGLNTANRMAELEAEIARLKAGAPLPEEQATPEQIDAAVTAADDEFDALTDAELKAIIKDKTGQAPRGTPSREFLLNAARELAA